MTTDRRPVAEGKALLRTEPGAASQRMNATAAYGQSHPAAAGLQRWGETGASWGRVNPFTRSADPSGSANKSNLDRSTELSVW
jgi:hypothetical protein